MLIGHSQGSLMLQQLIAREIEGKPVARQMKLAIIPGFNVLVPQGKLVGGTFKIDAALQPRRPDRLRHELGQLPREQPAAARRDLRLCADQPGMTVGCINPARPGSPRLGKARQLLGRALDAAGARRPDPLVDAKARRRRHYVRTEGLVSGRCVNDGPRGYLEIRTNADPRDKRTDRIGGEVGLLGLFMPGWGMHLADMRRSQGDLIRRSRRSALDRE